MAPEAIALSGTAPSDLDGDNVQQITRRRHQQHRHASRATSQHHIRPGVLEPPWVWWRL